MKKNADYWIKQLDLTPHPEGGYYKETIRETTNEAQRAPFSSIYFLLNTGDISHFHRIDADEVWYYHAGESLTIHMITPQELSISTIRRFQLKMATYCRI